MSEEQKQLSAGECEFVSALLKEHVEYYRMLVAHPKASEATRGKLGLLEGLMRKLEMKVIQARVQNILELPARHERVLELREKQKWTYREIGASIGTGAQRARQIYEEAATIRKNLADPDYPLQVFRGLSTRAYNVLFYHSITTPEEARAAFEKGKLRPLYYRMKHGYLDRHGWRGLGKKAFKEIADWAGFEIPATPKKKVRRSPHCFGAL